ncbi:hypothetical protein ACFRAR_12195 [Kitasatospora sp. NPDC056651]|uniref:hypothetical protein n=1 Tax=Kitasatospora sp. NPDC056651 TaxID=3345892 RepID=UPI0036926DE9
MSVWNTPAADRVAALREQAERSGEPSAALSDLELLNSAYESVLREQIDTRDRYMSLLTSLRKHDEQVRTAAVASFKGHADRFAQDAVRQHMRPFHELLYRVEKLPDRPGVQQLEDLRSVGVRVAHQLRDAGPAENLIDPDGARATLRSVHNVVGVLEGRPGLEGAEVLGLVKDVLAGEPPSAVFDVADHAGPRPEVPVAAPSFAGPGWSDLGRLWAFQDADSGAHVKAYPMGNEDWYLDLWSAQGQLLAFGSATADEVGALAPALTAAASTWSRDRSEYGWRRFADTVQAVRETPDQARVRAATSSSPSRTAGRTASPLVLPGAGAAAGPAAARRSR